MLYAYNNFNLINNKFKGLLSKGCIKVIWIKISQILYLSHFGQEEKMQIEYDYFLNGKNNCQLRLFSYDDGEYFFIAWQRPTLPCLKTKYHRRRRA